MKTNQWQGRHILEEAHHADLEREASAHEFGQARLGRKESEEAAYQSYRLKHHGAAIKHHLTELRRAVSGGYPKEAERHAALYTSHMKALGLRGGSMPPPDPDKSIHNKGSYGGFTPHPADQLLVKTGGRKANGG